jgi:hypothetical protein
MLRLPDSRWPARESGSGPDADIELLAGVSPVGMATRSTTGSGRHEIRFTRALSTA